MQIANALNNTIRILFNPRIEAFKLFDFLIVRSDDNRYLAQIIEIYDDKFDSSQDVAKIKLFYKITKTNEVMPYDNFTPNKECEIVKVNQEEIEEFLNQDKKTFVFGTNMKTSSSLNIQYDFFDNNAIILADKIENACTITNSLAKNLSSEKPVVVIDSTGIMDFDNAHVLKIAKNFKLPLNYSTIDFVFEKCLKDASLEFQTIAGEIINEIKKFSKKQENQFIPFNAFVRVLLEQYKATPYPELKILVMRLKKFQMDEIFARSQKDTQYLAKSVASNPVTVIDLSSVDVSWQKACFEYVVEAIQEKVYLITRINDENCDTDLINKIYNQKQNIQLVPNLSYNYKKLPSVIQYCKNYILLPSLYQRMDFLDANFALSNLISDGCIIFGENTDNFLYYANDYSIVAQEKRKNYRKIALSMAQRDALSTPDEASNDEFTEITEANAPSNSLQTSDSKKLMDELNRFEEERNRMHALNEGEAETFENIQNPEPVQNQAPERDVFDDAVEQAQPQAPVNQAKEEPKDFFEDLTQKEPQAPIEAVKPAPPVEKPQQPVVAPTPAPAPAPKPIAPAPALNPALNQAPKPIEAAKPEIKEAPKPQPQISAPKPEAKELTPQQLMEQRLLERVQKKQEPISEAPKEIKPVEAETKPESEAKKDFAFDDNFDVLDSYKSSSLSPDSDVKKEAPKEAEQKAEVKPEAVEAPKPEVKAEIKPEVKPEPAAEAKEEVKVEQKPEAKPELKIEKSADVPTLDVQLDVKPEKPEPPADVNIKGEEQATQTDIKGSSEDLSKIKELDEVIQLSDEELDFFEVGVAPIAPIAQEAKAEAPISKADVKLEPMGEEPKAEEKPIEQKVEEKPEQKAETKVDEEDDDLNLAELANNSINESFEQIINETPSAGLVNIKEDTGLVSIKPQDEQKENLPVFKEEVKKDAPKKEFAVGDTIQHKAYGKGTIVKIIKYEDRQLLQLEFEKVGKKLLDPNVADIKTE